MYIWKQTNGSEDETKENTEIITPIIEKNALIRYQKVIFLSNLAIIIVAIITCMRLITLIIIIIIYNIIFNNYTHTHLQSFTYNNNNYYKRKPKSKTKLKYTFKL